MNITPLAADMFVTILAGCRANGITKGAVARVQSVTPMGAECSHAVRVVLVLEGRTLVMWVRHPNRLSNPRVAMHDGNPFNRIEVRRGY
jgi:hypothetical protein